MLRWFIFTTFQEISLCCFRFSVPNCFSCVQLYATLWTAACQAPLPSFRDFLIQGTYQWPLCLLHWQVGPLPLAPPGKALCSQSVSQSVSSVAQSCPTLWDPMDWSTPGLPVHHQPSELTQTHVHWVGDAIQPSHPLSSPSPPAPNPSQHQGLFQWVNSLHEVAKVLEFQL